MYFRVQNIVAMNSGKSSLRWISLPLLFSNRVLLTQASTRSKQFHVIQTLIQLCRSLLRLISCFLFDQIALRTSDKTALSSDSGFRRQFCNTSEGPFRVRDLGKIIRWSTIETWNGSMLAAAIGVQLKNVSLKSVNRHQRSNRYNRNFH